MNLEMEIYTRKTLKEGLAKCDEDQQHLFKRMYAKGKVDLSINEVVDNMDEEKLDWAMTQVSKTINK